MDKILICGPRGVGKSTLIRRLTALYPGPVSGFVTKRDPVADGEGLIPKYIHHADSPEARRQYGPENLIGRCDSRRSVRCVVDFVITFEELSGMFEAKDIDFSQIPDLPSHYEASAPGVGFAAGGGVAKAVEDVIHRLHPEVEVKTVAAEGLENCRKMLRAARTGKYDGYLLEGMGCPGGCVAGAGTIQPVKQSAMSVEKFKGAAPEVSSTASPFLDKLKDVEE